MNHATSTSRLALVKKRVLCGRARARRAEKKHPGVRRFIFKHEVGETVKLSVRRGDQVVLFEIVTERMPDVGQTGP
ncbi:MAG: hypothetical protein BWK77_03050 [Verrucomicrobia bacterium A1]|nr:MAG: hypothetical protein BWK77_03050 [Verrucomicrobia bacterium A1]